MSAFKSLLGAAAIAAFVVPASAPAMAAVITPVSVVASSQLSGYGRVAVNTINSSGLTGLGHGTDPTTMWLSTGNGAAGGTPDLAPSITFDLGSVVSINSAQIWNYNESGGTNRGVTSFSFSSSLDGITYTSLSSFTLTAASGSAGDLAQTVAVTASAEFIRLSRLTSADTEGFVGLSEVRFTTANALIEGTGIPEPSSAALLLVGLVGCVFAVRGSRAKASMIGA